MTGGQEKILKEEPNDVIKNIEILAALRSAGETEPVRTVQAVSKPRNPKRQRKLVREVDVVYI